MLPTTFESFASGTLASSRSFESFTSNLFTAWSSSRESRIGTLAGSRGSATPSLPQIALRRWFPCWQTRIADEGRRALQEARRDAGPLDGQRYPYGNPNQSVRHMPDAFRDGKCGTPNAFKQARPDFEDEGLPPPTFQSNP